MERRRFDYWLLFRFWCLSLAVLIMIALTEYMLDPKANDFIERIFLVPALLWIAWPVFALWFGFDLLNQTSRASFDVASLRLVALFASFLVPGLTAMVFGVLSALAGKPVLNWAIFCVMAYALWLLVRSLAGWPQPGF